MFNIKVSVSYLEEISKFQSLQPHSLCFVRRFIPFEDIMFAIISQVCVMQHRNQRMAEDQSVVGRRRIYYDQHGSEALICSDSEEDVEPEEEKHDFSEGEDRILW